jgi:hypothetical protein
LFFSAIEKFWGLIGLGVVIGLLISSIFTIPSWLYRWWNHEKASDLKQSIDSPLLPVSRRPVWIFSALGLGLECVFVSTAYLSSLVIPKQTISIYHMLSGLTLFFCMIVGGIAWYVMKQPSQLMREPDPNHQKQK